MDGSSPVASVNASCIICDRSVVIEAWDKIGYIDVDVDVDIAVDVHIWILWQWCICLSMCDVVVTIVRQKLISCWVRSCGLQLILHNLSSPHIGPKLNVEEV